MKNNFWVLVVICLFAGLTSGFLWTFSDASTTASVDIYGTIRLIGYNISVTGIDSENATITWNTNGDANSTVEYGTTTGYGSTSTDDGLASSHTIRLNRLSPGTRYHYRVISKTTGGESCSSPDRTFKTLLPAGTIVASVTKGTTFTGVTTSTVAGVPQVALDLSAITGTTQVAGNTVTISNPGNGWSSVQYTGTTVTTEGQNISINGLQDVTMQADPLTADLGGSIGTVSTGMDIALTQLVPGVSIQQNIIQGASTAVAHAFQLAAAGSNLDVRSVAYTVEFQNTGLLNANLGSAGVTLDLSVDHAWVVENAPDGDINNIRILRFSEDGTKEVLTTEYTGSQGSTDYFKARSPHGLSMFGVASVGPGSPVPPAPPSPAPVPGYVYSPDSVSESSDSGMPGGAASAKVTTMPTTRKTTVPVTSPTHVNRQQADRAPQQPTPKTPPPLRAPEDVPAYVGYLVEENLLKMGMLAGAAIIGAALVIYYSQQTRRE
jgi:hypothetical protein